MEHQLKSGQLVLCDEPFNIKNVNTWLNPFVKFFINIWNKTNGTPYVSYSHSGIIANHNGELYFWEAVSKGFIPTKPIRERFKGQEILVLTPDFDYDPTFIDVICLQLEGTPYDYEGVLVSQSIHQLTNERVWVEINKNNYSKKFYCIEVCCYIYNIINEKIFTKWYECDQKDVFFEKNFKHDKIQL